MPAPTSKKAASDAHVEKKRKQETPEPQVDKKSRAAAPAAAVPAVNAELILQNLEARLASHSKSINTFLSTIPAKFYVVDDAEPEEHRSKYTQNPSGKGVKKNEMKEKKRAAKQARLDPEKAKSIEELQKEMDARQKRAAEEEEAEADDEANDDDEDEDEDENEDEGEEGEEGDDSEGLEWESDEEDEDEDEEEDDAGSEGDNDDDDEEEEEEDEEEASRSKRTKTDRPFLLAGPLNSVPAASLDELRQRLHAKIEQTRGGRKAPTADGRTAKKSKKEKEKEKEKEKQKKLGKQLAHSDAKDRVPRPNSAPRAEATEGGSGIQFSKFDFVKKEKKQRPTTQQLLAKVQTQQEKLEKLAETNKEKAAKVASKQAWQKALQRADGEKVFDDPTLLKKTLKRKRQEKKQSSTAWNKRTESTEKEKTERIDRRETNIKARQDARKDRKMGKKKPKKTAAKKPQKKNDKFVKGKGKFVPNRK